MVNLIWSFNEGFWEEVRLGAEKEIAEEEVAAGVPRCVDGIKERAGLKVSWREKKPNSEGEIFKC